MRDQPRFFDVDDRLKRLSDLGDQIIAAPGDAKSSPSALSVSRLMSGSGFPPRVSANICSTNSQIFCTVRSTRASPTRLPKLPIPKSPYLPESDVRPGCETRAISVGADAEGR